MPDQLEEGGSEPQHRNSKQPVTRVHVRVDSKVRGTLRQDLHRSPVLFFYTFFFRPGSSRQRRVEDKRPAAHGRHGTVAPKALFS